ncbi:MAG: DUF1553 domain-containing protein [Planctomycetota bacterium]|nr:DUF1553 domain-containing protein [Planctomycetota bacterium]
MLYQGDHTSPREEVPPGFVSVLSPEPAVCEPPREATSGRRLALARWIASAENPWTARVFVNRVWQQHFGVGLVATPNDFGYSGSPPTHPELLDWLAREFVRGGWSVKELHRIILKSATYRQSSRAPLEKSTSPRQHAIEQHDPGNSLYWRQNVRRLDAESLRDSLLSVAGLLRPYDSGRALWPEVPEELLHAQPAILEAQKGDDGGRMQGWYTDPVGETDVRSVFLVRKRCLPVPFLQAFDLPDSIVSCARRDTTVVAPQALLLLNSPEAVRTAQGVADRVREQASDDLRSLVETAFRVVLAREPDGEERELGLEALRGLIETRGVANEETGRLALIDFCRALLNLNEFAYVD